MLYIGRPLTLLALAVCTYIILTWSYRSTTTEISTKPDYIYDENGFRIPTQPHTGQKEEHSKPQEVVQDEEVVVVTTTRKSSAAAAAAVTESQQGKATKVTTKLAKTYTAESDLPMATLEPAEHQKYMLGMLNWNRPGHVDGHWPDYVAYDYEEYDPNRWEGFEMYVLGQWELCGESPADMR